MSHTRTSARRERGSILLVVILIATAIAGLAAISSSRVVSESKRQTVLEQETKAFKSAYAQLHVAMNVINTSAYDDLNRNVALRNSLAGLFGGTIAGTAEAGTPAGEGLFTRAGGITTIIDEDDDDDDDGELGELDDVEETLKSTFNGGEVPGDLDRAKKLPESATHWLDHKDDPKYGFIPGTGVRVYRGRDYIRRLQRLKGQAINAVDATGDSDAYFILEAAGRSGDTVRLVSALVRESEPFSSFVFFQNRATLGVSGAPRGLIHTNEKLDFYFPNGNYVDTVSAVGGFGYRAGATEGNTSVRDGNPASQPIALETVDFGKLKDKANLYTGAAGLDAEVRLRGDRIQVRPHTPPRYVEVTNEYTYNRWVGTEDVTVTDTVQVKVGEETVPVTRRVIDRYDTEVYYETEQVQVGTTTETYTENVRVQTGTRTVERTRQDPVYEEREVTKTRRVRTWVPYDTGGTAGGGGAAGGLGEWGGKEEQYQTTELVQVGSETVTYNVQEPVYETQSVQRTRTVPVYKDEVVERTRRVPVYKTITENVVQDVYEDREVEVTRTVNVYEPVTVTYSSWEYHRPQYFDRVDLSLGDGQSGTIFVDGRVTELAGSVQGRLTIVGNEKVRITGNIQYVDDDGDTAMRNGTDFSKPYERNTDYDGKSVLGVVSRDDIIFTRRLPDNAEINGTLMSVNGRVGVDGFLADATGELTQDSWRARRDLLDWESYVVEAAYDRVGDYRSRSFVKESLRRMGGVISNNRILETYVTTDRHGYAQVSAGFKRGTMRYDINLLFNPPPNFVEVPRPVVTAFVPIVLVRNNDS